VTTSPVTTITDDLLAEIESAAEAATNKSWNDTLGDELEFADIDGEDQAFILAASPENVHAIITELRTLRAENEALAKDAERFRLFAETVVAEFNEKQLTPPQRALFTAMNSREEVSDVADLAAMFDAAMQESAK
jgi:hypothetical protein